MKIGILTFHNVHNMGASLQAWALQETIKRMGHEPYVIHYHPKILDHSYDPCHSRTGLYRGLVACKVVLTEPRKMIKYYRYKYFIKKNYNLLGDFIKYDDLLKYEFDLNAVIVGSDQVWNNDHIEGEFEAFFLEFLPKEVKKISYAASIGKKFIEEKYHEHIKENLKSFHAISVRESSTVEYVENISGCSVESVLDPTLLLKRKDYEKLKTKSDYHNQYIYVYMIEENQELIKLVEKISEETKLPIMHNNLNKLFCNEFKSSFEKTPDEFLSIIENAEYILTNSFHGTVFSILYNKKFLSMLHSETGA